ncbi:hypothetical protein HQ47_05035 [Porphyromonas macacae]|uniref:Uncharacterized protein n=1 Tax=Porphyromonas macacae TaxID=28115 RepID=A0A0A2E9W7_9PORP|nr:hypothetical protein [Porphyromonas macacae]KGN74412.1 hypothetical protein HQ47_05035 [Porphyromonas macacae]
MQTVSEQSILVCVASALLGSLLITAPFIASTHFVISGEERYCEEICREDYLRYKATLLLLPDSIKTDF